MTEHLGVQVSNSQGELRDAEAFPNNIADCADRTRGALRWRRALATERNSKPLISRVGLDGEISRLAVAIQIRCSREHARVSGRFTTFLAN